MYKRYFFGFATLLSLLFTIKATATIEQQFSTQDIFSPQQYQLEFLKTNDEKNAAVVAYITQPKTINRSGCCSWHNGVCGCSTGRAFCCDGSYSPTCDC